MPSLWREHLLSWCLGSFQLAAYTNVSWSLSILEHSCLVQIRAQMGKQAQHKNFHSCQRMQGLNYHFDRSGQHCSLYLLGILKTSIFPLKLVRTRFDEPSSCQGTNRLSHSSICFILPPPYCSWSWGDGSWICFSRSPTGHLQRYQTQAYQIDFLKWRHSSETWLQWLDLSNLWHPRGVGQT